MKRSTLDNPNKLIANQCYFICLYLTGKNVNIVFNMHHERSP